MKKLLDQMRKELEHERMRYIQVLLRYSNRKPCIKFNFVDTEEYKIRLKKICDNHADKLVLIKETSTTLLYEIKEDHHEIMA